MPRDNIIVGIDVASTKIAVCVGQVDEGITNIIGFSRVPNTGLRKGIVTDLEDTISSLSMALEEAERMSGVSIKNATVNIGGMQNHVTVPPAADPIGSQTHPGMGALNDIGLDYAPGIDGN